MKKFEERLLELLFSGNKEGVALWISLSIVVASCLAYIGVMIVMGITAPDIPLDEATYLFFDLPVDEALQPIFRRIALLSASGIFTSVIVIWFVCYEEENETLSKPAEEKQQIESKIEEEKSGNIQKIIKLNLDQLDEYYTINKSQSKRSYNLSSIMIIVGFLLLVATVIMFLMDSEAYISVITGLAGLISKFIGLTSLYLFKESNKHSNEFITRLAYLQKVMLAIDLTENISSEEKKYDRISNIINGLINLDEEV